MADFSTLKAVYEAAGQGHVFAYLDLLSPEERASFHAQLSDIKPDRVNVAFKKAMDAAAAAQNVSPENSGIEPLPRQTLESLVPSGDSAADAQLAKTSEEHRRRGLAAIARGQVAVLLMAGGQGTRLGSADPKGCYNIGLPSQKSLFQLQAERIKSLQRVAAKEAGVSEEKVKIPWYVMTSAPTHDKTRAFFGWGSDGQVATTTGKVNFGLDEDQVIFFQQGVLPCLNEPEGKILLETTSKVAVAPDGNGGLYAALRKPLTKAKNNLDAASILFDLSRRGIEHVHAYCVDNSLVRVADPVFLGSVIAHGSDCAAKTVRKIDPRESVGVVAMKEGAYAVVEYSEITPEMADCRESDGKLAFSAANIVNHVYTRAFLERTEAMEEALAPHVARKKIPSLPIAPTPSQNAIQTRQAAPPKQDKYPGVKLELFVFDVFPHSQRFRVVEVPRADEFSPLKNAPGAGTDCPETARGDLLAQQRRWLEAAGAKLGNGVEVEISPLVSYAGEGLENVQGKMFTKSGLVESLADFQNLL